MEEKTTEIAVFGGGCFWCTEAVFKMLKGVTSVVPGYSNGKDILDSQGKLRAPTYDEVSSGTTNYAEVTRVEFDPSQISFNDLMTVFFASHDPTTRNRQGNDVGTQYRSGIFYTTDRQKEEVEKFVQELNDSNAMGKTIVTEVVPLANFFEAENYHHDYYARNKNAAYCELVINPKLEKVQQKFADLLKANE